MEGQTARNRGNPGFLSAASDGEQHNMELEKRKRLIKQLAQALEKLLDQDQVEKRFLAAPAEIHRQFLNELGRDARRKTK